MKTKSNQRRDLWIPQGWP